MILRLIQLSKNIQFSILLIFSIQSGKPALSITLAGFKQNHIYWYAWAIIHFRFCEGPSGVRARGVFENCGERRAAEGFKRLADVRVEIFSIHT